MKNFNILIKLIILIYGIHIICSKKNKKTKYDSPNQKIIFNKNNKEK